MRYHLLNLLHCLLHLDIGQHPVHQCQWVSLQCGVPLEERTTYRSNDMSWCILSSRPKTTSHSTDIYHCRIDFIYGEGQVFSSQTVPMAEREATHLHTTCCSTLLDQPIQSLYSKLDIQEYFVDFTEYSTLF